MDLESMVKWINESKLPKDKLIEFKPRPYDSFVFVLENDAYKCSLFVNKVMIHRENLPYHVVSVGFDICGIEAYIEDHYCLFGHQMFMLKDGSLTDLHRKSLIS